MASGILEKGDLKNYPENLCLLTPNPLERAQDRAILFFIV